MDFVTADFAYYKRSVKLMYQRYYQARLGAIGGVAAIIVLYLAIMREAWLLNGALLIILCALGIFLWQQLQQFEEIFAKWQAENETEKIFTVVEDEYSFIVTQGLTSYRLRKKGLRNFPSKNQQYTLMVGFAKNFFAKEPLVLVYYDLLDLKYEENFRLKRNGLNRVPRPLRAFTPSNLKATFGSLTRMIFSNLFMLFILYRIIRYLIAFISQFTR